MGVPAILEWLAIGLLSVAFIAILRYARQPRCDRCSRRHAPLNGPVNRISGRATLKPNGRLAIVCFEVDPAKVEGLPVLGVDPIADYAPILEEAGFTMDVCEETPGWADRVYRTFKAVIAASDALTAEMGGPAAEGVLSEAELTVAMRPYPRRVLIIARRLS